MDPILALIVGLLLGSGLTFIAQASISSGWLGKKSSAPPALPAQKRGDV